MNSQIIMKRKKPIQFNKKKKIFQFQLVEIFYANKSRHKK